MHAPRDRACAKGLVMPNERSLAGVLGELEQAALAASRIELPGVLGRLTELEMRVRLRLLEPLQVAVAEARPPIDVAAAAAIAGTSKRWLLSHTKGLRFRCDLSRKQPRFDEAGLRHWLSESLKGRKARG